jgi:glycyl-tRNA synthetase beta chain
MADADIMGKALLVEIGVEELPILSVDTLAKAFFDGVVTGLKAHAFGVDSKEEEPVGGYLCTPRRLAVHIPWVASAQPVFDSETLGPPVSAGFDADGQPTEALIGFAKRNGVDVKDIERKQTDKGERFLCRARSGGQTLAQMLPKIVSDALAGLPIPKPMRWGDHEFAFVRPVHWLVMLHGDRVIEGELFGVKSGRQSRGHRFMHPAPVHLADADSYADALRAAKVLVDPIERRQRICDEVARVVPPGTTLRLDDALLGELANLNEWPVAIECAFDKDFLAVPHEALVMTMRANQKFVPVFDANGQLTEHFIGIANLESRDPAQIRHGYERVIRPRFADAKYFFDEDMKTPLASFQYGLKDVTYQKALGSLWDKTVRVAELATVIAERLLAQGIDVDVAQAARVAGLSRCDLLTRMVGEFPELQGVMGRHYATAQGEPAVVANALDEFYRPRNAGDGIAEGVLAQCVSLADKLDTLAGIFAVGMKPTGNKDPFALRRTALGVARTLIEGGLDLDIEKLLHEHVKLVLAHMREVAIKLKKEESHGLIGHAEAGDFITPLVAEISAFILDRLRSYYIERGFTTQQFEAVAAVHPASLLDFDRRLRAVAAFAEQPEAEKLAAANKRVANILRKEGIDVEAAAQRDLAPALLREPAEQALAEALEAAREDNGPRLETDAAARDYAGALSRLSQLQAPVDAFFDSVMVMAEDSALRANRIALLARIKASFDAVADIAQL